MDYLAGLFAKTLRATGGDAFRGNQAALGEIIALRRMFWSFSNAMAHNPQPWAGGAVLPNLESALCYRTFMPEVSLRSIAAAASA
jgi:4-hydroxyphenylacetate 3-monooxygenase